MQDFFVGIYRFFAARRLVFWLVFASVLALMISGALTIKIEEDVTKFFPDDKRAEKINRIFQKSSFSDRIVVMVSVRDSTTRIAPAHLIGFTDSLVTRMEKELAVHHPTINSRVDDERLLEVFDIILNHLPVFLEDDDYKYLDSITRPDVSRAVLRHQYQQLISPSGLALKRLIVNDPLGFSFLVLKKLQELQYDDNFELYDSYIITRDYRHVLFFIQAGHGSNETGKNAALIDNLARVSNDFNANNPAVAVSFFGAPSVAVGNAQQLRQDTILTLSLLGVLLAVLIFGFFKDWRIFPLILVPVLLGVLFSLSALSLIKGTVSILALAAGSAILGIAVNYALHFLVLLRDHPEKEVVIRDLTRPMTLGSLTTVLAFFSLQFTSAAVLKDIGLFAGFSLIGAVLASLIFLPHLCPPIPYRETFIEHTFFKRAPRSRWAILLLAITPLFLFFASDVKFNSNMASMNFMSEETRTAQQRLETINPASLHTMYIASEGKTMERALRNNDHLTPRIDSLISAGVIKKCHSLSSFLLSDSLQRIRINRWKTFWTAERRAALSPEVNDEGRKLKFSPRVLSNLDSLIKKQFTALDPSSFDFLRKAFFENNLITTESDVTIVSMVNVLPGDRAMVEAALQGTPGSTLDRQMITASLVELVSADFNFIVAFTSLLVFFVLLISLGRIELTVITFLPMLITWIWILGIMALLGIEFNIVNVLISTFIFGLGDDYSIFVMDGLLKEYKTGMKHLRSVRTSIFLSSVTTICGLGVLIFAEHPALRSIAAIAIIGIVCVFMMAQTIQPYLFSLLVSDRVRKGRAPMSLKGMFITFMTYGLFVLGSVFLTLTGLLFKLLPFRAQVKQLWYHKLIRFFTGAVMYVAFNLRKKFLFEGRNVFVRPGIVIANHSSFIDILLTAMLHPKLVLLTTRWVWNSPVFGGVVRLAGYYPVMEGFEESVAKLRDRVLDGYSIVIFPEGSRSEDGVRRFHKGAFYLAEKLSLPIYPLLIYGAGYAVPKGSMYVNDANVTLKMLPPIEPADDRFGETYSKRTKNISHYFKEQYRELVRGELTPRSCRYQLYNNYRYKGPVLEWYLRIKLRIENYYDTFNRLIPENASVIDLGCGYGFLCYMLQFLSEGRTITGVDYDNEKIEVAKNGYLRSERLRFVAADITSIDLGTYDVIILSDVVHYLRTEEQYKLLLKCFRSLHSGGKIILRDGDVDLEQRHHGTKLTEFFSVRLLKFNKANNDLNFPSGRSLTDFARQHDLEVEKIDQGGVTSNVIFVLSKKYA